MKQRTTSDSRRAVRSYAFRPALFAVVLALPLTQTATLSAQVLPRAVPESVGFSSERLAEATGLLQQLVQEQKIAGAVAAVARRGKLAYLEAVGVQDLATRTPMTERSLLRIYSMTKSVTAVAAMMLHEEGKFALDDPVAKYIPEFANVKVGLPDGTTRQPARGITVADLLLHTSGLNHRTSAIYRDEKVRAREMTMAQFIANLVRVPLMEDPGTRFRYSESTTIVGHLVEVWSGMPFDQFLEARIFRPLGMTDTRFWAATPEQRARLATVYAPVPGGGITPVEIETVPFSERPTLIEGAVGLLATVPDYLRFSQMLLNKGELGGIRLLKTSTVEAMVRNGLSDAIQQARGGSNGWGLANVNVLLRANPNNPASVGEYSWDGTAGTIFWVDPVQETIIILMTQSAPSNPDQIRQRFKAIVQRARID
ncbi:MAG: serine hydrolase [Gemmatimonadota bacterium]|nr:serine hydrolase [Gemmatimonadota bacterium]